MAHPDAELLELAARANPAALGELYDRYAPLLFSVAEKVLRDRQEAEDLLHEVFLEAWKHASDYDPERGSVRAWLLTRVRSRAIDRRRTLDRSRRLLSEPPMHAFVPAGQPLSHDLAGVRRAMSALPPDLRVLLELGYFHEMSSTDIAAEVRIPVGTVKSRVARAMAALRAVLRKGED